MKSGIPSLNLPAHGGQAVLDNLGRGQVSVNPPE